MLDDQPNQPPPSTSQLVSALATMRDEQHQLLDQLIPRDRRPVDAVGHLLVAVLRRSLALAEGFLLLVDQGNRYCALPLVRLQLDNAMRVFACSIAPDPSALIRHTLEGKELHKFAYKGKEKLSDAVLHTELSKSYPLCSEVYKHSAGYIHLSRQHMFEVFDIADLKQGEAFFVDYHELPHWPEEERSGAIVDFLWATDVLLEESKKLAAKHTELGGERGHDCQV